MFIIIFLILMLLRCVRLIMLNHFYLEFDQSGSFRIHQQEQYKGTTGLPYLNYTSLWYCYIIHSCISFLDYTYRFDCHQDKNPTKLPIAAIVLICYIIWNLIPARLFPSSCLVDEYPDCRPSKLTGELDKAPRILNITVLFDRAFLYD